MRPVSPKRLVSTIVQKDDISAANPRGHFPLYVLGRGRVPTEAGHAPHHGIEDQLPHGSQNRRTARSPRWTKKVRVLSNCISECGSALLEFPANAAGRLEGEKWMRKGVIRDHVPAVFHFE